MSETASRRPSATLLMILVGLTGLGAIPAGIAFLADPSGAALGMTPDMLMRGPFREYTIPGAFLLVALGLGALPVVWALWSRRGWGTTAALAYGVTLLAWLSIQALIVGILSPLQPIYGTLGLLIAAFALAARA